jgi:type I restriction enzyme M protein
MTTLNELNASLWQTANILRGSAEPSEYKNFVIPLLFFKRLSDTWDAEHAKAIAEFGDDLDETIETDYHTFVLPEGSHWSDIRAVQENVGEALSKMFSAIEEANPARLAGIFGNVDWSDKDRLTDETLNRLVDKLSELDLSPDSISPDLLGEGYEFLLQKFADASGAKAGQFFTPREVVRLLARLADVQPHEDIYDPTCGSGGILVEAVQEIKEAGNPASVVRCFGQEAIRITSSIARINLMLHGVTRFDVQRGDTLADPKFLTEGGALQTFDAVLANPPFSEANRSHKTWAEDRFGRGKWGVGPSKPADWAFVTHIAASMKEGTGRAAIVLPDGALFRPKGEAAVREGLVKAGLVEGIVVLPKNLFYNTDISCVVLVLRRTPRADLAGKVVLYDARDMFEQLTGQGRNRLVNADQIASEWKSLTGDRVHVVDVATLKKNGWDMSPSLYLPGEEKEERTLESAIAAVTEARARLAAAEVALGSLFGDPS